MDPIFVKHALDLVVLLGGGFAAFIYRRDRYARLIVLVAAGYALLVVLLAPFWKEVSLPFELKLLVSFGPIICAALVAGLILGRRRKFIAGCVEQAKQLMLDGRSTEALAILDRGLSATPDVAVLYFTRGQCHELIGNADLARGDFQRASDLGWQKAISEEKSS